MITNATRIFNLALVVLLMAASNSAQAGSRDKQWKQVEAAIAKGLPKTAVEKLEPIIAGALQDKNYGEAIKAIGKRIALEGNVQGNKPEEKITRLQAEITKAPPEMTPVMDALLANWYWHYFQQNRWRFLQRTRTAEAPGKDFTTWDLPRLFAEIDKQFTRALAADKPLQATPVSAFDDLLEKGNVPDSYRPTLFDFLAHNALEFYVSGEQAAAKAEDAFELSADSPIFSPVEEFLKWPVETTDVDSPVVKAIRLYQQLLAFHQADKDPAARLDADLARLNFGHNTAFGEAKNSRYKAALKRFVDRWGDHELAARALFHGAVVLRDEGDLAQAHQLAQQGVNAWRKTVGGRQCHNLLQEIEAKSASVSTERVWNSPWPTIDVQYRNLTKVYFRAVRDDWLERVKGQAYHPEGLDGEQRQALLRKQPDLAWSADLPATGDYRERVEKLSAPKDLKPGFYFLISSHDPGFGEQHNLVSFTDLWVSNLALVMRTSPKAGQLEGFVLNAASGEPLAGAAVQGWYWTNNNRRVAVRPVKTNEHGLFQLPGPEQQSFLIHVQHQDQQLATGRDYTTNRAQPRPEPQKQTVFFTDRSLYRPGQTIQYKGLCIRVDQEADNYRVLGGQELTVVFADSNGQEIARQRHRTNDYGSCSGSFTAPRDRLMGQMHIRVEGEPSGASSFNVEEYKRPKFQVTLDAPKVAAKLNAVVSLAGKAAAYTGAAVGGAKVKYRVVREVRYPSWWGWCFWWRLPQTNSQELAHGSATTEADGAFTVEFTAKADLAVSPDDEPTFQFAIYADVTDLTGETRSGERRINLGYTALQASLTASQWQTIAKPVEIAIRTTTLDGEGQPAEGSLKVYRLKPPEQVQRGALDESRHSLPPSLRAGGRDAEAPPDLANPNSWPLGDVVFDQGFTTDAAGNAQAVIPLEAGAYRALLETQDRFGKKVKAQLPIQVLDPAAAKLNIKIPQLVAAPQWSLEPGSQFTALWGSGYDQARAFIEIEHRQKLVQSFWTKPGQTQVLVKQSISEAMRGGFTLRVTMVRENRAYLTARQIDVPWSNKNLTVKWEHFVSKLGPGQKATWTAVVTGPDAKQATAEMVAGMYDASLDAYLAHQWLTRLSGFRQDYSAVNWQFENFAKGLQHLQGGWPVDHQDANLTYRSFPAEIVANLWGYRHFSFREKGMARGAGFAEAEMSLGAPMPMMAQAAPAMDIASPSPPPPADPGAANPAAGLDVYAAEAGGGRPGPPTPKPDLSQVSPRKNLNETAFFFPHLLCDEQGQVKLEFTMPEALTEWKFMGFAHDKELRSGYLQDKAVTAKDLMVEPNPPRFVREGDSIEFTVKVTNQSPTRQAGQVRLSLASARTLKPVDQELGNTAADLAFDIPSKESRSFAWRLQIPDGMEFLTYKAVGSTGRLSDGEEGYLPVLSRRILVTESLPLPILGATTKKFDFTKLRESGKSDTLVNQSLTVQMVSNPAWYAVMALPYLMEFPHECTEQTFNRLYANALARHVANSDVKIRRVFDQWKHPSQPPLGQGGERGGALESPLEKNQDLKAVLLEETPWVRQAHAESQARRNVGVLFDDNRLNDETTRGLRKLTEQQLGDGAWPWFPGGPANDYITLYITTGFGRLRHLGADLDVACAVKSLNRLDGWIDNTYREILKHGHQDENQLSSTIALYLYGRSFFLKDQPIASNHKAAVKYFLGQARKYWLQLACRQSQGHLAVALNRFGDSAAVPFAKGELQGVAQDILRSIKERSVTDEELGMFWRDTELSWWWYRAPIETQALMIEAFDEVMHDAVAVENCKVWLLKQKQTQDWKTTKATADAVYALLLRGTGLLASDALVEVSLGGLAIKPEQVEAGTGFYEQRFTRGEIKPDMGRVTVKKLDPGVAWGSVHWQYLEDMTKVTPAAGTPLKLKKSLFVKENTKQGPVLKPVSGALAVGDELVVRIELWVDRDMEYIHLKDQRGSGTEPVNVLSQYKYQDGLAYYESTRDTASHFFIDYLPKGVYVFEYSTRVVHKGKYQTGLAQIQCMYAPEFNSHSESFELKVR
ncbi:MAG: MG2 domain-containing protein [Planctomycetota bacterium]|nr:MG2 domain-containing protein [Planctomycetota bacterium]